MNDDTAVYNLGVVDPSPVAETRKARAAAVPRSISKAAPLAARRPLDTLADSLELFVPGSGQLLRARWSDGLFVLTGAGFLIAFAWAIWQTLERLPEMLLALGLPPHGGVYVLAMLYVGLAGLHTANLFYGTTRGSDRAHPLLAGCASVFVPGWGQLLNRQPAKAAAFVAGLWSVGIAWLLASPWTAAWFESQGVGLRRGLDVLSSPAVLWTAPAVLWALSVYDAVATARSRIEPS